jgi:hypothetical protein
VTRGGGDIPDHQEGQARATTRTGRALALLTRPLTVRQLAAKLAYPLDETTELLRRLRHGGRVRCLNPDARRGRVYTSTTNTNDSAVDWSLYGWVCFHQRRAVLEALDEARSPAAIKRRARFLHPGIRLSANNVRDIIREFREHDLVRPVAARGRAHPAYALSPTGAVLQRLVWENEARQ